MFLNPRDSNISWGFTTIETNSFETIYFRPIHLKPLHLRPRSFETTFTWDFSFETTFTWDFSFETTLILRHGKVKLFWFTVNHIFMICRPLYCGRPEVLQGDFSFEFARLRPSVSKVTHAGLQMHSHFRTPQRPENSSYLGFRRERCTSEMSFRPSQRIICFAFLPVSCIEEAPLLFQFLTEKWNTRKEKNVILRCSKQS